jgi:hypothetical protein
MEESTLKAVRFKIGIDRNAFRSEGIKYVTAQEMTTNKALALYLGYQHILDELFPKLEAGLIDYCLKVGSRDVDFITGELRPALTEELHSLGSSLYRGSHTPATLGAVSQTYLAFKSDADVCLAGLYKRVLVTVEARIHSDPPASPTPQFQSAPTVSSVQQHGGVTAMHYTEVTHNYPAASHVPEANKTKGQRKRYYISTLLTILTIVVVYTILAVYGAWPRESNKDPAAVPGARVESPTSIDQHGQNNQQENSFTLHKPVTIGAPPRQITEQNRQEIRAFIPKEGLVGITAAMGDNEALQFAWQLYDFMKSDGYVHFKTAGVSPGFALISKPPLSMQITEDGSYLIFVNQQR